MNWSWLLPSIKGISVLMYHKVWPGISDDLTITPEHLAQQWAYLKQQGYNTLSLPDFIGIIEAGAPCPPKSLLITFDDGYRNNYQYAYPLLKEMGWQATFFIIAETLSLASSKENTPDTKMSLAELKALDPEVVQLALHGLHHEHFSKLTSNEIKEVMQQSIAAFDNSGLTYHKVLAYPYGSRPKDAATNKSMKAFFKEMGLRAAFRIGNQVCKVPATDKYELRRIDIKGTDALHEFKIKLTKGKLKPF